jgi:hypothetical protein
MKYKNIQELVPAGEYFDESAIVNEGGYLSIKHLQAIEERLEENTLENDSTEQALQIANENISSQQADIDQLKKEAAENTATIASQAKKIASLEKKLAEAGQEESGNGTTLVTLVDEISEIKKSSGLPSYKDPEHPANKLAGKWVKGSVKN